MHVHYLERHLYGRVQVGTVKGDIFVPRQVAAAHLEVVNAAIVPTAVVEGFGESQSRAVGLQGHGRDDIAQRHGRVVVDDRDLHLATGLVAAGILCLVRHYVVARRHVVVGTRARTHFPHGRDGHLAAIVEDGRFRQLDGAHTGRRIGINHLLAGAFDLRWSRIHHLDDLHVGQLLIGAQVEDEPGAHDLAGTAAGRVDLIDV